MAGATKKPSATERAIARKKTKCDQCGLVPPKHKGDCPNAQCDECGRMISVGHDVKCSKHLVLDGKTGGVLETEVDGKKAKVKLGTRPPDPDDDDEDDEEPRGKGDGKRRAFFPIVLLDGALEALQQSYDAGDFSGEKQRQDQCDFEDVADGAPALCAHVAVVKKVVKQHCDACDRDQKSTVAKLCLGHAVNVWGGNAPSRLQMEMDL